MAVRAPSAIREQQLNREHTLMLNDQDLRQLGVGPGGHSWQQAINLIS
jgi:23S rRNA U2552 (ribose-2'-O)-methylase RlmE/FtsJ